VPVLASSIGAVLAASSLLVARTAPVEPLERAAAPTSIPSPPTPPTSLPAAETTSPAATVLPLPAVRPTGPCLRTPGQCRRLTITGSIFGALAAAAIGTGVGLVVKPDQEIPDQPAFLESYEPAGVVLIGMGVGVLLTGVLMIIAGRRAHRLGLDGTSVRRPAFGARF
jgi:hypothetical protein